MVINFTFFSLKGSSLSCVLKFCFVVFFVGSVSTPLSAQQFLKSILFNHSSEGAEAEQGKSKSLQEYIVASDNNPITTKLSAIDNAGKIPTWLTVNSRILNGVYYTAGSEITFNFDATNLSIGTYYSTVTASAIGYNKAVLNIKLSVIASSSGSLTNIKINFQEAATIPPSGWIRDYGQAFAARTSAYQGSGYTFGWIKRSDNTPLNLTLNGKKRYTPSDILLATFIHMQGGDGINFNGNTTEGKWQAKVANGNYAVTISVGEGTQTDSKHSINVEGVKVISRFIPTAGAMFKSATVIVSVSDGYLTVDAIGGFNTKINWIIIKPYTGKRPSVVSVNPGSSSVNVSENTSISTNVLKLPNGGINNASITTSTVRLIEDATGTVVPSNVNGTGGGDAITLVPNSPLKLSTTYKFTITSGVKDLSDSSFITYSSKFTTSSASSSNLTNIHFNKVNLPNTTGQHTSITIGPDGKLYALTIDGIIKRFTIKADGTLGTPQLLYSLQDEYGTRTQKLAVGFTFDPSSTAANLVAWVTHDTYVFYNAPDWDGKLSKLSGPNLETVQDVLINLPRSKKDHTTNSIAFGPDRALYFTQSSTSAMGRADQTWGNRSEHLLSAALLRLDVSKLGSLPLNVKTAEGGGTYNPYNPNAPLTIYASGIRNAYDLVWHSNGNLYLPTNSSAAGGNTPASVNGTLRPDGTVYNGPSVPALTNVQQTPTDFLLRIVKGGYYGHPNPLRGQFVLNSGNTNSTTDPAQITDYPSGTAPDPNYRGHSFDFQLHASPDGAIEYKSNSFNGALKGKLLVVRYSQHKDIITLTPGGSKNDIVSATEGYQIGGFSGFNDPLDLTENIKNGNLYVSEYGGGGKITLLKPAAVAFKTAVKKTLEPAADAYIRDGDYSGKNYGAEASLNIKGAAVVGYNRKTYLKFSLDSIKHVYRAILRLYGNNTDNLTSINISAFGVTNDTWTEKGITLSNAPACQATPLSSVSVNSELKYYQFDVTDFVQTQFNGDKIVSMIIKDTENKQQNLLFRSKESTGYHPQLVITVDSISQASLNYNMTSPMPLRMSVTNPSCDDTSIAIIPTNNIGLPMALTNELEKPKIYPNPFNKKFNLQLYSKKEENVVLQIADPAGKIFELGTRQLRPGITNIQTDISNLALKPGVYFLKINRTTKLELIKLIIQ